MGKLGWFMSRTQTLTSLPREGESAGTSNFEENVRKEQFEEEINTATISLRLSVDEAVKRLSECLLTAAHCMVRTTKEQIKIHNLQKKIQDIDKEQKAKLQN